MNPSMGPQMPMIDPELYRKELERQVQAIDLRIMYLDSMRIGVSQQGVAKQKLLELKISGLDYDMPPCDSPAFGAVVAMRNHEKELLKHQRDGVGRECKAKCDLLTLDLQALQLQRIRLKEQIEAMEQRVFVPGSRAM